MRIAKPADSDLDKADHTVFGLKKTRDAGYKHLRNYSSATNSATVAWDFNEAATRDGMFKLSVNGKDYIFNKEEFMRALRWI